MFDSRRVLSKDLIFFLHHLARHVTLHVTSSRSNSTHGVESIKHLFTVSPKPQFFEATTICSVSTWLITLLLPFTLRISLINLLDWPFYIFSWAHIFLAFATSLFHHLFEYAPTRVTFACWSSKFDSFVSNHSTSLSTSWIELSSLR